MRYIATDDNSITELHGLHTCCHCAIVIDTKTNDCICECVILATAELIANALNDNSTFYGLQS